MSALLPDPLRFTARAVEGLGGLVDPHGERMSALLPPEAARALGVPEVAELTLHGDAGAIACGIGSPLLDALVERARAAAPVAAVRLPGPAPSASALQTLAAAYTIRNGVATIGAVGASEAWYARVALKWQVEADERHEGTLLVAVHPEDGALPSAELATRADGEAITPGASSLRLGAWLSRLIPGTVGPATASLLAMTARRHRRDHERIAAYYGELIAESRRPKRRVDPAAIAAKVQHLTSERDSRLADLGHRYGARASVRVAGVLWVRVAVGTVTLLARRRKGQREIALRMPGGTRAFDRLPCDACAGWLTRPALCDDRLHLLCEACAPEISGRPRCRACG